MSVYVERNLSPIFGPNPYYDKNNPQAAPQWVRDVDSSDLLLSFGARPYFMVYDGTLNNARLWANDDGTLPANIPIGGPFDWEHRTGNYSNPPAAAQIQACARLALNPAASGCKLPGGVPIFFDIEACKTLNFSAIDPVERWVEAINLTTQMVQQVRAVNQRSPVFSLNLPLMSSASGPNTPNIISLDSHYLQALKPLLSGASVMAYLPMYYGDWVNDPEGWFDWIDKLVRDRDRYFDTYPLYVMISPTYWAFGEDHSKDGTPLPPDLWHEKLAYLQKRGVEIVIWLGGKSIQQIGRTNLDAIRRYLKD